MKKSIALIVILAALFVLMIPSFASEPVSTKTTSIPKVPAGAITIDAAKDSLYTGEAIPLNEQNLTYFPNSPQDTSGTVWAAWDGSYIYLYAEINDPNIDRSNENYGTGETTWERDMFGIQVDLDYNRTVDYEYSYADNGDHVLYVNLTSDNYIQSWHMTEAGQPLYDKIQHAAKEDDAAHKIYYEMALPLPTDAVTISDGMKVGFEPVAIDAQNGGRVGEISWSPAGSEMWHYTHVCGTAVLEAMQVETAAVTDAAAASTPAAADTAVAVAAAPAAAAAAASTVAPQTADPITAVIAALMMAAAVIPAIRKRLK